LDSPTSLVQKLHANLKFSRALPSTTSFLLSYHGLETSFRPLIPNFPIPPSTVMHIPLRLPKQLATDQFNSLKAPSAGSTLLLNVIINDRGLHKLVKTKGATKRHRRPKYNKQLNDRKTSRLNKFDFHDLFHSVTFRSLTNCILVSICFVLDPLVAVLTIWIAPIFPLLLSLVRQF
jgi:hypothetical protein